MTYIVFSGTLNPTHFTSPRYLNYNIISWTCFNAQSIYDFLLVDWTLELFQCIVKLDFF